MKVKAFFTVTVLIYSQDAQNYYNCLLISSRMPLLLSKKVNDHAAYGVWKIAETNSQLEEISPRKPPIDYHPTKQAEWMATRILVENLCQRFNLPFQGIVKDANGKPFLKSSTAQISISHSFPIAAAMIHTSGPCGIDIEWPRDILHRIKHKFLNSAELQYQNDLEKLCIIWTAKEAIYKRYGKKKLSFRDEMRITINEDAIIGEILKEGPIRTHSSRMRKSKSVLFSTLPLSYPPPLNANSTLIIEKS